MTAWITEGNTPSEPISTSAGFTITGTIRDSTDSRQASDDA